MLVAICLFIGAIIGFFAAALCSAAARGDAFREAVRPPKGYNPPPQGEKVEPESTSAQSFTDLKSEDLYKAKKY